MFLFLLASAPDATPEYLSLSDINAMITQNITKHSHNTCFKITKYSHKNIVISHGDEAFPSF